MSWDLTELNSNVIQSLINSISSYVKPNLKKLWGLSEIIYKTFLVQYLVHSGGSLNGVNSSKSDGVSHNGVLVGTWKHNEI